jgi:hypothetical protein
VTMAVDLDGRGRYERRMHGWSDDSADDAFTHTVRLADDEWSIKLRVACTLASDYAIRDVRCAQLFDVTGDGLKLLEVRS